MPVWLISIITHIGFKVTSIVLAIALILLTLFSWIKLHDAKVRAVAIASCPPQIKAEPGSNVNIDQRVIRMTCFPIPRIGHFGLGFCHD